MMPNALGWPDRVLGCVYDLNVHCVNLSVVLRRLYDG